MPCFCCCFLKKSWIFLLSVLSPLKIWLLRLTIVDNSHIRAILYMRLCWSCVPWDSSVRSVLVFLPSLIFFSVVSSMLTIYFSSFHIWLSHIFTKSLICCSLRTSSISLKLASSVFYVKGWFCNGLAIQLAQTPQIVWKSRFLELMMLEYGIGGGGKIFPCSTRQNIPLYFRGLHGNFNSRILVFAYADFCTVGSID